MENTWMIFSYFIIFTVLLFCFDDLFIDFIAIVFNLKPKAISMDQLSKMHNMPQKRIAIMIANWHEADIIERMIHGNIGRVDYSNYDIFLGVYPNDVETVVAAQRLEVAYSLVHVVINSKNGPTSKGQMLNEIVQYITATEIREKKFYDIFMLHDSEDIIHPLSLKLVNDEMEEVDFLQTPVFSLPTRWTDLTRAIYIDEFTESHTKDMLVRSFLKGGVPSAGVGTAMSHLVVSEVKQLHNGQLLKEDTLTEDYHLGLMAQRLGYESKFVCSYLQKKNRLDYIATREYFPALTSTSIRQKTRWTLGISFQGYANLKWSKTLTENYFLWRDRRSFLNAIILVLSYALTVSYVGYYLISGDWPKFLTSDHVLLGVLSLNFYFMAIRLVQRYRLVFELNGFKLTLLIPVRWLLANYINTLASFKAFKTYRESIRTGTRPQWVKTAHELPTFFGATPMTPPEAHIENLKTEQNSKIQTAEQTL
ncbi:MAG: glycosyltransferase [Bdellovibrionota bacterium]